MYFDSLVFASVFVLIYGTAIPEIELSELKKIKTLFISSSYIKNADLIIEMENLESVTIWHDKSGELSLDAFYQLPNLKKLSLFDCNIKDDEETQKYINKLENKLEEFDITNE